MSGILRSISKGASYMVWGTNAEDEKYGNNGNNGNNNNNNGSNGNEANVKGKGKEQEQDNGDVFASAKGELWKYSEKNENFKLIMRNVDIKIIEQNNNEFLCSFEIFKPNGDLLLREPLTNDLQIQYNKSSHSMLFSILNEKDNKVSVLQFIFGTPHDENELKWRIGIKLMEYNRQESFDKLLKGNEFGDSEKEANEWICNAYENDAENDDYQEDETDWRDLDSDVVMRNFANLSIADDNSNKMNDEKYNDNNDNNDNDDNDDNEQDNQEEDDNDDDYDKEEEKANVWQKAANKKLDKDEMNRYISNAKAFNRSYVIRETKPGESVLGYFKHNDDNELVYKGKVQLDDVKGNKFTPYKAMQFKSDRNMLLLSDQKPGIVSVLNVDRGKVIEEWQGKPDEYGGTLDIAPLSKFDELTDNTQLYGMNKNSLFLMDGRINKQNKLVDSKSQTYKTKVGMSTITTSGQGFIATGSDNGQIRLYDCVEKRAKTLLPGLGSAIKHIETTNDGKWLLSTCDDFIMVIPTVVPGTERLGFTGRGMGKQKPKPYVLKLRTNDIAKYKIRKVSFTPAHFDTSNDSTFEEHWIVTSTGPFIIKWNFNKLKKSGIVNSYSIRRAKTQVVHNQFRWKYGDDLLVSETDNVYAQHSVKHDKK